MGEQQTMFGVPPRGCEELSQWFTPRKLAAMLVEWADIDGFVLEPSAGDGAFVEALLSRGCRVIANDIDPKMADYLRAQYPEDETPALVDVVCSDFLGGGWKPNTFDWVVMNSPYEDGQDTSHLEHACEVGLAVLALVRGPALHGVERFTRIWSRQRVAKVGAFVRRPSFFLGGDTTGGPRHEFCAVVIDRKHVGPTEFEWFL